MHQLERAGARSARLDPSEAASKSNQFEENWRRSNNSVKNQTRINGNKMASSKKSGAAASEGGAATPVADFTKQEDLDAYRQMLLIRRFEEKAGQLYGMGFIGGFIPAWRAARLKIVDCLRAA